MSSLIFCTDDKQAIVATDTLAVATDGAPAFFTTKAFAVPHLRMIIAGTGAAGFCGRWLTHVNDRMAVRDIDNLDCHAPAFLPALWKDYRNEFGYPETFATSIYHFGFKGEDVLMRTHVYRSVTNFASEALPCSIGAKPDCTIPDEPFRIPEDFIALMNEQRMRESLRPYEQRIHIGGEVQVIHLTPAGFYSYRAHRFPDFEEVQEKVMALHFGDCQEISK